VPDVRKIEDALVRQLEMDVAKIEVYYRNQGDGGDKNEIYDYEYLTRSVVPELDKFDL
jgi:hypothetical protein